MSDVICAKCGEPWEYYGIQVNDATTPAEGKRILRGEGCPCCKFGTACPQCDGSGFYDDSWPAAPKCDTCRGNRRVLVWRYVSGGTPPYSDGQWRHGYSNSPGGAHRIPADTKVLETFDRGPSADGIGEQGWAECWACSAETAPRCDRCDGTGKLKIADPAELEFEAMKSECDASDLDPIEIMHRRGF